MLSKFVAPIIGIALLTIGQPHKDLPKPAAEQYSTMVWDEACILKVYKTSTTKVIADMVDGLPDFKNAKLTGVGADIIPSCGRIVVNRK